VNKMLIAFAAAFLAVTALFGSGAQAGFNVRLGVPSGFSNVHTAGCGGGGYFRSYRKRSYSTARRSVKRNVEVARKPAADTVSVAKVEEKVEATSKVAETENSSISAANGKVAELKVDLPKSSEPEKKVAVAKDVGCKKFFPSVGMTLTVPCE
jgi:hypothetical protein